MYTHTYSVYMTYVRENGLGGCPPIGILRTSDFGKCPLIEIVRTINYRKYKTELSEQLISGATY